jgi:hypothetical protein
MISNYKLDKLFGPAGTFAGYMLLIAGVVSLYFTLTALPLILLGGAMTFSFYDSEIDALKKCYRINLKLFGLYPIGKWRNFRTDDKLSVQHFSGKYTSYSRGNRQSDVTQTDFRVMLAVQGSEKKYHLAKFPGAKQAQELAKQLNELIQTLQ